MSKAIPPPVHSAIAQWLYRMFVTGPYAGELKAIASQQEHTPASSGKEE
jgi:hypothetical protein